MSGVLVHVSLLWQRGLHSLDWLLCWALQSGWPAASTETLHHNPCTSCPVPAPCSRSGCTMWTRRRRPAWPLRPAWPRWQRTPRGCANGQSCRLVAGEEGVWGHVCVVLPEHGPVQAELLEAALLGCPALLSFPDLRLSLRAGLPAPDPCMCFRLPPRCRLTLCGVSWTRRCSCCWMRCSASLPSWRTARRG